LPSANLTGDLLKRVSRSFYLSLAVLPAPVRPILGLAYLFARAADTIADSRLIGREQRITHLLAFRDELAVDQCGQALRDAHAAEARGLHERRPGRRSVPPHVVEHLAEPCGAVPTLH